MRQITVKRAYELADWAVRVACPAFLEYSDGVRRNFPEEAAKLRECFEIKNRTTAQSAIDTIKQGIIPGMCQFRDGMPTLPLKQAIFQCIAAMSIEAGRAVPMDYGSEGIHDVAQYMRVPLHV